MNKVAYWFPTSHVVNYADYTERSLIFKMIDAKPFYAKIESLDDIGHDIAWFKENRSWV